MQKVYRIPLPYLSDSSAVFKQIADESWPIWLDSGKGFKAHHIDIIAANPIQKLILNSPGNSLSTNASNLSVAKHSENCFRQVDDGIQKIKHNQPHGPGWIGFLSYDLFPFLEKVEADNKKNNLLPLVCLGLYGYTIVTNHLTKETSIYTLSETREAANELASKLKKLDKDDNNKKQFTLLSDFTPQINKEKYEQQFRKVKSYITSGDTYQVNLTQQFSAQCEGDSLAAFEALRLQHSSPMSAYFKTSNFEILSMSPERFIKVTASTIETQPIKGTRPRGKDEMTDKLLKSELSASEKDRAENVMIVDLLRNDLGRICQTGSVRTDKLFDVESYPNVHHLVSTVSGTLKENISAYELVKAAFPGGSITGAPKVRAMEIIEELEQHRRGIYCGSFFHFCGNGDIDSNIAIRTLLMKDNHIHCWGGGGIVADSDCDKEYQETWDKVGKLMNILTTEFKR